MRVLVVSNMAPAADRPERGGFVRDQVAALRRRGDVEVELLEFPPGGYRRAAGRLLRDRRRHDVVHAHFGLTAVPALAARATVRGVTLHGRDLRHGRSRIVTRAALPAQDVVGLASEDLRAWLPPRARSRAVALPVGVALERLGRSDPAQARRALGLDPAAAFVLFPYGPERRVKRVDRARALAAALGLPLRELGGEAPDRMPLWFAAASLVVVPSEHEGFGLVVVEALACGARVLSTPTGVHAEATAGIPGAACLPWSPAGWLQAAGRLLDAPRPGDDGAERAARWGTDRCAGTLVRAWREALRASLDSPGRRGPRRRSDPTVTSACRAPSTASAVARTPTPRPGSPTRPRPAPPPPRPSTNRPA